MNHYNIIIIGAGPAGLALAQCLRNTYKKILIIEKEAEIGGCHRVIRVPISISSSNSSSIIERIFTEHSPRIYSSTYKTFDMLLKDMSSSFDSLFIQYNFSITAIGGKTILSTLTFQELLKIGLQFFFLIFDNNHGTTKTIGQFIKDNNFSDASIDIINRITRLTDGAGDDRYTLNKFLEIFNQQFFYKLYQPRLPNDQGLFKLWEEFLTGNGITIMKNTSVDHINLDPISGLVKSVIVTKADNSYFEEIYGDKIVLAMPPQSFLSILRNSTPIIQNTFMNLNELQKYSTNTAYMTYISLTFHWNILLNLPSVYGFPKSAWGLAFIVLTDYMTFTESISKTVISCTITFTDVPNMSSNGKTANHYTDSIHDKELLLMEAFLQLQESFPNLPIPTISLLSPEMSYVIDSSGVGKWETSGNSFITSSREGFLPFTGTIPNLFNVGTQNGKQIYKFTSLESTVTNAVYLSHILYPKLRHVYKIGNIYTLVDLFLIMLIIITVIILFIIYKLVDNNKNVK